MVVLSLTDLYYPINIGQRFASRVGQSYVQSILASLKSLFVRLTWLATRSMFDVAFFYGYMVRYHDYN